MYGGRKMSIGKSQMIKEDNFLMIQPNVSKPEIPMNWHYYPKSIFNFNVEPFIKESLEKIKEYFSGIDYQIKISPFYMPDEEKNYLNIEIFSNLSMDEAFIRLKRFDEEWYVNQTPEVRDNTIVDINFFS
jgi:hypothetical protein